MPSPPNQNDWLVCLAVNMLPVHSVCQMVLLTLGKLCGGFSADGAANPSALEFTCRLAAFNLVVPWFTQHVQHK